MNINAFGNIEKTVVLVNQFAYLPGEGMQLRTMYLYDMMRRLGHKPILVTSNFNHIRKCIRNTIQFKNDYPEYDDIVFLHTRTYRKNLSLSRLLAEYDFTRAVKKWVTQNCDKIDIIMLNMPYASTILSIKNICKQYNIEIAIDIRDLRPESFKLLIKNDIVYRFFTYPMKLRANAAYACADKLFAVSQEYLQRGMVKGASAKSRQVIYIGSPIDKFDDGVKKYSSEIIHPENELWLTYIGTLGTSYDLTTVIAAVHQLKNESFNGKKIKFLILGQGPDRQLLENYAQKIDANNVVFLGFVEYEKMSAYLASSDIAINAIKKRSAGSIINKIGDYFAAGIPVLNGSMCLEVQNMIQNNNTGLNYEAENISDLISKIKQLAYNQAIREEMGRNARRLALEKFDRRITYRNIVDILYG